MSNEFLENFIDSLTEKRAERMIIKIKAIKGVGGRSATTGTAFQGLRMPLMSAIGMLLMRQKRYVDYLSFKLNDAALAKVKRKLDNLEHPIEVDKDNPAWLSDEDLGKEYKIERVRTVNNYFQRLAAWINPNVPVRNALQYLLAYRSLPDMIYMLCHKEWPMDGHDYLHSNLEKLTKMAQADNRTEPSLTTSYDSVTGLSYNDEIDPGKRLWFSTDY